MKLSPLTRYDPRPVGIVRPGARALEVDTADGTLTANGRRDVEALLERLAGFVLFVHDSVEPVIHTTGALSWTMRLWHGRITRAVHTPTGVSIVSLRGTVDPANTLDDVLSFLSWARGYGVAPGSIPAMAWSLFRASLARPYSAGFDPEVGRSAFYGGRQEVTGTGTFRNMAQMDIRSAYPAAMARPEGYALTLREVDPSTVLDPTAAGIAAAVVHVPLDAPVAPLPIRLDRETITFQRGHLEGLWPWCELDAARRQGAEVTVTRCWAPARCADLFGPWWPIVEEGRNLPGGAGMLAKAVSNSTWGQFGMIADERATRHYADEAGKRFVDVELPDHDLPHTWTAHIAAETTGRVRAQMLEALPTTSPVHIDTDGLIVPASTPVPGGGTGEPGEWRVKSLLPVIEIHGPQLYRYTCEACEVDHDRWHYTTAGVPAEQAERLFSSTSTKITVRRSRVSSLPPA